MSSQEDMNRGKPNWEHLNDDLHVLITVEDSENRAQMKIARAVDEVKKLLTVVSMNSSRNRSHVVSVKSSISDSHSMTHLVWLLHWHQRF